MNKRLHAREDFKDRDRDRHLEEMDIVEWFKQSPETTNDKQNKLELLNENAERNSKYYDEEFLHDNRESNV